MAGINLSQSLLEKQAQARGQFFDRSLLFTFGGLIFILAVFGGLHWYVGRLESKAQAIDTAIAEKTASLRGSEVNRLIDFSYRLNLIGDHLVTEPDPTAALQQIEAYTLPTVRLTGYAYKQEEGEISIDGLANSLKEVAQQMLAFKNIADVTHIKVDKIEFDKNGKIAFSFIATRADGAKSTTP